MVTFNNPQTELTELDFVEGTLVEYQLGMGFEVEFDRSRIVSAEISEDYIDIKTDGRGCLEWKAGLSDGWEVHKKDDVFYMTNPQFYGYALAQRGTDIPQKPTCD